MMILNQGCPTTSTVISLRSCCSVSPYPSALSELMSSNIKQAAQNLWVIFDLCFDDQVFCIFSLKIGSLLSTVNTKSCTCFFISCQLITFITWESASLLCLQSNKSSGARLITWTKKHHPCTCLRTLAPLFDF